MISFTSKGSFKKTEAFLKRAAKVDVLGVLKANGQAGVNALAQVSPIESGLASNSWGFEVSGSRTSCEIVWTNSDVENGFPVIIRLHYGYGTGTGGYVQGRDFINPAIRPIFDKIGNEVWKAVTSA